MGVEWLAYPLILYGACFTLLGPHFALVFGSGMHWDTMVSSIVKTVTRSAREQRLCGGDKPMSGPHSLLILGLAQKLRNPF